MKEPRSNAGKMAQKRKETCTISFVEGESGAGPGQGGPALPRGELEKTAGNIWDRRIFNATVKEVVGRPNPRPHPRDPRKAKHDAPSSESEQRRPEGQLGLARRI